MSFLYEILAADNISPEEVEKELGTAPEGVESGSPDSPCRRISVYRLFIDKSHPPDCKKIPEKGRGGCGSGSVSGFFH